MQRRMLTRIASTLLLLAVLLPTTTRSQVQAEETATADDEIVYVDSSGRIKVIDPNVAPGTQAITWESPDVGWFDVAAGDFNNDGDAEIVAIGNNKVTIFDPVMQPNSGLTPDGVINNVPWIRLYESGIPAPNIVSAGNLDQGVAGDEIVFGYSFDEGNGIVYRMTVIKRTDTQGRAWTTHATAGFGAPWKFVRAGNIDNQGSGDIVRLRDAATAAVQAAQIDNNWATIFERNRDSFTFTSAAIGQFVAGGPSEVVVTRTFPGTTEAPSVLVYQFVNNAWVTSGFEYVYFPHPFFAFFADINGNGDDELFWIRDVPSNASSPRMVMINVGGDALPAFEIGLDADNGYRVGAGGDVDADGRDEIVVMRATRIFQYNDPENGPTANTRFWDISGNGRSLALANVDGTGYAAADQFAVNLSEISVSLPAGTFSDPNAVQTVQLSVIGANPIVQFTVAKESNSTWFDVSASSSTTPASIFVRSFNAVRLKPGIYTDRIVVQAVGGGISNSPIYITVNLQVLELEFSTTPANLNFLFGIGDTASKQKAVELTSPYGALTYSTALMPQPPFEAAVAALGEEPSFGYRSENGDIVLVNALGEEYRIEVPEDAQVSAAATVWPSVAWANVQSTGNVMPDTIFITATPTLMTQPQEKAILVVIADERTGVYPNNIKIVPVIAAKDQFMNYLPRLWK